MKIEIPKIYPWKREVLDNPIDFNNPVEVNHWCYQMHHYHLENDTEDALYRWNIGVYQLAYIPSLISNPNALEWSEAIASAYIHAVASFENLGVCCSIDVGYDAKSTVLDPVDVQDVYNDVLVMIPRVTRQLYYCVNKRKKRFNKVSFDVMCIAYIKGLIRLNYSATPFNMHFSDGLALAMDKLVAKEFRTH